MKPGKRKKLSNDKASDVWSFSWKSSKRASPPFDEHCHDGFSGSA